jgi:hypothetical protein
LTNWSEWVCDGSNAKRTRNCIEPTNGGRPCEGPLEETKPCDNKIWIYIVIVIIIFLILSSSSCIIY